MRRGGAVAMVLAVLLVTASRATALLGLDETEVRRLLQHGPWPAAVVRDPSNAVSGPWSDDRSGTATVKTRHVEATHASFGQFKTPSLRNLAHTAPYMHDGRYATLREAVRHYSELDMERIHTHGEQLLRPLKLTPGEIDDLVAFLESLTEPTAARVPPRVVEGCF